jgi:hypothetical protein
VTKCNSDLVTFRYGSVERLIHDEATQYTTRKLLELTDTERKQSIILSNFPHKLDFPWWNNQEDEVSPPHPYMAATGHTNYRVLDVDDLARQVGSSCHSLCIVGKNNRHANGHTPSNAGNQATWSLVPAIVIANFGDYDRTSRTIIGQTMVDLAQYLEDKKTWERLKWLERVSRVGGGEHQRTGMSSRHI